MSSSSSSSSSSSFVNRPNIDLSGETTPDKINLSLLPSNIPSLCIPRVYKNISQEKILRIVEALDLGTVDHIDIVPIKNAGVGTDRRISSGSSGATGSAASMDASKFNRVFIHMNWNSSGDANKVRERLLSDKEVKIIYDEPWFWKVRANRSQNSSNSGGGSGSGNGSRPPLRNHSVLDFDDEPRDSSLLQRKGAAQQSSRDEGRRPTRFSDRDDLRRPPLPPPTAARQDARFQGRTSAYSDPRNATTRDDRGRREYCESDLRIHRQQPRFTSTRGAREESFRPSSPTFPPPQSPSPRVNVDIVVVADDVAVVADDAIVADESSSSLEFQGNAGIKTSSSNMFDVDAPKNDAVAGKLIDYGVIDPNVTIRRRKYVVKKEKKEVATATASAAATDAGCYCY